MPLTLQVLAGKTRERVACTDASAPRLTAAQPCPQCATSDPPWDQKRIQSLLMPPRRNKLYAYVSSVGHGRLRRDKRSATMKTTLVDDGSSTLRTSSPSYNSRESSDRRQCTGLLRKSTLSETRLYISPNRRSAWLGQIDAVPCSLQQSPSLARRELKLGLQSCVRHVYSYGQALRYNHTAPQETFCNPFDQNPT